jgi:hypothetical protein
VSRRADPMEFKATRCTFVHAADVPECALSRYDRLSQELSTGESQRLAAYASAEGWCPCQSKP